ncbi:MAG: hypothetical protein WBA97_32745 [Actinophytocola sp.]|uniref:hypothetical protein n=1 Tax=Actinophytocola sp. TaxID=1872138 RepID=UPI003C788949
MSIHPATATPDAATHSHSLAGLISVAVLVLVVIAAGYLTTCWLFPFTRCRHTSERHYLRCRHCQSTGTRLRAGRRFLNHIRAARRR